MMARSESRKVIQSSASSRSRFHICNMVIKISWHEYIIIVQTCIGQGPIRRPKVISSIGHCPYPERVRRLYRSVRHKRHQYLERISLLSLPRIVDISCLRKTCMHRRSAGSDCYGICVNQAIFAVCAVDHEFLEVEAVV